MSKILLKGGKIIDSKKAIERRADVLIESRKIIAIATGSSLKPAQIKGAKVIDCKGKFVCPGLIDMNVHLREPGHDEEETIESGLTAAIHGGFTAVVCMGDTNPAVDNEASVEFVIQQATRAKQARCYPVGAVTVGRESDELCEMGLLSRAGAVAFSDGDCPIDHSGLMLRALEYANMCARPIICDCREKHLMNGVMNSGNEATRLGFSGVPSLCEELIVYRDIAMAESVDAQIHISQVSTTRSVRLIRDAKKRGVKVTADVSVYHLLLDDECVAKSNYNTNFKVYPPLRGKKEAKALLKGLQDGTIDAIASNHAPVSAELKELEFTQAPFGAIGLESTLPVLLTALVKTGKMTLAALVQKLSFAPANVLGLPGGSLEMGGIADVTVIDPSFDHVIDATQFKSKSLNCPFNGWQVSGGASLVIVDGRVHTLRK